MKAIILAAGEGVRLRPVTNNIPKCLVDLNGKPLLEYWLDNCEKNGASEALINGHYLADRLKDYLDSVRDKYSMKIKFIYEPELLGTGGTLKNNADFVKGEEFFFFCHGDNFTNINISDFVDFHKTKGGKLSVALFKTGRPKECGIAEEMDENGKIMKFTEKPEHPKSDLASAAIFLMSPEILDDLPAEKHIDFSKEVLPQYQGKMFGYHIKGFNIDIGTLKNYELAKEIAKDYENAVL